MKATIRELEKIKDQLYIDDLDEFDRRISPMREEALDALKSFVALNESRQHLTTMNTSQACTEFCLVLLVFISFCYIFVLVEFPVIE